MKHPSSSQTHTLHLVSVAPVLSRALLAFAISAEFYEGILKIISSGVSSRPNRTKTAADTKEGGGRRTPNRTENLENKSAG